MLDVFNGIFAEGSYPSEWSMAILIPCFKQGDPKVSSNDHPISLTPMLCAFMLLKRLTRWAESNPIRASAEAGKAYRTTEQLYIMRILIASAGAQRKKLYCAFVDFSKAFDTVKG